MMPAFFGVRLLGRSYLILILIVVVLITGMSTGFGLFYRLLYALVLTTVLSYVWNWLTMRSLEVKVEWRTRQARAGDTVEEMISVRNHSKLPKAGLEIDVLTDLPGYTGGMVLNLMGNASTSWKTEAKARKRGLYRLGPVRVSNSDPFGLFRRERLFGEADPLTIFPRTFNLSGFDVPAAELSGDTSMRKRTHQVTPHASSIKEYASGDSLSRVHWNSTARLGKLMSKVFDLGRAGEVWVMIDLHRDVQAGELEESTDEYAVSIGASLAKRYLESQEPVGLVTYGDQRYLLQAETGAGQFERIMEHLAMCKAEGITPLEVVLAEEEALWGPQSSLVVITSSPRQEWVGALKELVKRGVRVAVVLVDADSFGGFLNTLDVLEEIYLAGLPTYVVRKGDDIPSAMRLKYTWSEAEASEQLQEAGSGP